MDEKFKEAVKKTLEHEGGCVNDPKDPGGETKFGISKKSYPDLDIAGLTRDEAEQIYFTDWWEKYRYGEIDDGAIAAKVFDLAINMGPRRAHWLLQIAVNYAGTPVCIDGVIGRQTLSAINGQTPAFLLALLKVEAVKYYVSRENARYEKGWVARAVS